MSATDLVMVTGQIPFDAERTADGEILWTPRPDDVRAAFAPRITGGPATSWVGWSGVPDLSVDVFTDEGLAVHPVSLSTDEVRDYFEGFANATIWPLYHDALHRPVFDQGWWDVYVKVNRRFATAVSAMAPENAQVLVHDYPLQLVPGLLRELRPDLRIGFFLDTPFPPVELFMKLPWRIEIIRGLLGADLVGFHRPGGAQNFLWLARRLVGLEPSRGAVGVRTRPGIIQVGDRNVRVGAFPRSIDSAAFDNLARRRETSRRAVEIREALGNPRKVLLGVDRLDNTKGIGELNYSLGIDVRLQALHDILADGRLEPDDIAFVQLIVPGTRADGRHYQQLRHDVERVVRRINSQFATSRPIVHYIQQPMSPQERAAYYLAADVLTVTAMRDGMNMVAKEYVACRHDIGGALVLSEFAGAAAELTSAFLINPYDIRVVKDAIDAAVHVEPTEGRRRMRGLRRQVLTHDSDRWSRAYLDALNT